MEMEYTPGKIEKFMMVNGIKDWRKDMAFGKEVAMIAILVNGLVQKHMATVSILGRMEIDMKDSGECVWNMDKDMIIFAMEILTLVIILMENLTEKENIFGLPDKFIQEIFTKDLNKVEESGGVVKINPQRQTFTKVSIIMTKSMVKVFSLGQLAIFTKAIILKMNVMETDKCYGPTAACMKVNGKKEFNMVSVG